MKSKNIYFSTLLIIVFTLSYGLANANNQINKNDNNENVTEKISSKNNSSIISNDSANIFTDPRDGKKYPIATIGNQTWMAKNLAFVPEVGEYKEFVHPDINSEDFGLYYKYETAQNVCPLGWRLASSEDWKELAAFIQDNNSTNIKKIKSIDGWAEYDETISVTNGQDGVWDENYMEGESFFKETGDKLSGNGTNTTGFNALPTGEYDPILTIGDLPGFQKIGLYTHWWTSDSALIILYNFENEFGNNLMVRKLVNRFDLPRYEQYYLNIRCIQGNPKTQENNIENIENNELKQNNSEDAPTDELKELFNRARNIFGR
jgi:hypothetical protein